MAEAQPRSARPADPTDPRRLAEHLCPLRPACGTQPSQNRANLQGPQQSSVGVLTKTVGWVRSCTHDADVVPCTVLDPFSGANTTVSVAKRLRRRGVGIDLNPEYVKHRNKTLAQGVLL